MKTRHVYFGGSFDPPHLGHHQLLLALLRDASVSKVHLVPTAINPFKESGTPEALRAIYQQRRRWMDLWIASISHEGLSGDQSKKLSMEWLELERLERGLTDAVYTVDTLEALQTQTQTAPSDWVLCVGSDVAPQLGKWKHPERLLSMISELWIVTRKQTQPESLALLVQKIPELLWATACSVRILALDLPEVSSTELRVALESGATQQIQAMPLLASLKEDLLTMVASKKAP